MLKLLDQSQPQALEVFLLDDFRVYSFDFIMILIQQIMSLLAELFKLIAVNLEKGQNRLLIFLHTYIMISLFLQKLSSCLLLKHFMSFFHFSKVRNHIRPSNNLTAFNDRVCTFYYVVKPFF